MKPQINHHVPLIVKYIASKKLDTTLRVEKAIEYALAHISNIDTNKLEEFCGVGVVVTPEEIESAVERLITEYKSELLEKRYRFNSGQLMQKVRSALPWADGKAIKNEVDLQVWLRLQYFNATFSCCFSSCMYHRMLELELLFVRT